MRIKNSMDSTDGQIDIIVTQLESGWCCCKRHDLSVVAVLVPSPLSSFLVLSIAYTYTPQTNLCLDGSAGPMTSVPTHFIMCANIDRCTMRTCPSTSFAPHSSQSQVNPPTMHTMHVYVNTNASSEHNSSAHRVAHANVRSTCPTRFPAHAL